MRIATLTSALLMTIVTMTASAQEKPLDIPTTSEGWNINVGAGAILSPNYLGDDAYSVSAVPFIRATYEDRFFASIEEGVGYALIESNGFRIGPLAQVEFGRDEDGSSTFRVAGTKTTDLAGLGDIDTSVSLGAFADYKLGDVTLRAKAGQALGGHKGMKGEIGLSYNPIIQDFGPPIILSIGPQLSYGDDDFSEAFFGVTPAQSIAAGLPAFAASNGLTSYGVSGLAIMPVSKTASLTFISSYKRLSGDAKNSPLVRQRGSKDQFFLGIIASYALK